MGEFADYANDGSWGGWMPRRPRRSYNPRCKFCGRTCTWSMHQGGWRLYEKGAVHVCNLNKPAPDDFEAAQ